MKKNIVIFDYWSRAIKKQIIPILKHLDSSIFDFYLVSFSSIVGYEDDLRQIDDVKCFDYLSLSKISISKIFTHFRPSLILILNSHTLIDRAIIKCSKYYNVPVFYIQHGLSMMNLEGVDGINKFYEGRYTFSKYLKNIKKYSFSFLIYLLISIKIDKYYLFKSEFYKILFDSLWNPVRFLYFPPCSALNVPTISFVYGNTDKDNLIKYFCYNSADIIVIGSILFEDYMDYINNEKELEYKSILLNSHNLTQGNNFVLLLPTIYVESGIIDKDVFLNYFRQVIFTIMNNNLNLIIKLHPSSDESMYSEFYSLNNVILIKNENLSKLISMSDLVISEPSTAIINAVLLRKKIILLRFFEQHKNDFDIVKEEVAIGCESIEQLDDYLKYINIFKDDLISEYYDAFIEKYCNYTKSKPSYIIADYINRNVFKNI